MRRSETRILTTHVRSLIRPPELGEGVARGVGGETQLREAVMAVVARQVRTGLDIVNDGEYGKSSWSAYILERLTGFEVRQSQLQPLYWLGRDRIRFAEF